MIATTTGTVESLASGGAGVVRVEDGKVVLVPGVVPGDRVEIALEPAKKGTRAPRMTARLLRLIEPGEARVEPPCPVVAACGGCDWMSLEVSAQAGEHAKIVRAELSHALGVEVAPPRVHPAARALAYRTRARLHVVADGKRVRVGYHAAKSRDLVEPAECAVLEPGLLEAARSLASHLRGARTEGEISVGWGRRNDVRLPVVDVRVAGDAPQALWKAVSDLVEAGVLAGARILLGGAASPATFGDPRPVQIGFDDRPVILPAGGFAQPSDEGAAQLARRVAELARAEDADVQELFAGAGTLTIALAKAARVASTEIDAAAVACAKENLALRGLSAKASIGDAETSPIPKRANIVVLDPPRTGAAGACRAIAAAKPKRVVYVSCDPPTLARDARVLAAAGYALAELETFELFPQTSHVESVAVFERAKKVSP
ncbi:MAG: class I SAM-dependent RNA methyltransferase [Polyangiaceae bacterium]|nr:class I SAM-dependent RNA methyltransferase [Polyangiaceae bacterium]